MPRQLHSAVTTEPTAKTVCSICKNKWLELSCLNLKGLEQIVCIFLFWQVIWFDWSMPDFNCFQNDCIKNMFWTLKTNDVSRWIWPAMNCIILGYNKSQKYKYTHNTIMYCMFFTLCACT